MSELANQSVLIQEELVRQIRDATRWSAVVEAWDALLMVQMRANSMLAEERHLLGPQETAQSDSKAR